MKKKQKTNKEKILDVRKPKEKDYVLKRNGYLKVLRAFLWAFIVFFFVKGILVTAQPTDEEQIDQTIKNFKQEFATFKGENEEIMSFAQNFAREYLTYSTKDEEGYRNRLQPYVSDRFLNMTDITDFSSNAEATYVQAYRKEQYSENQYDVYVLADITYTYTDSFSDEDGTITTVKHTKTDKSYLKIPVYAANGAYIIEDLPVFVADSLLFGDYDTAAISGSKASDAVTADIKTTLLNFFSAYYEADQSVIDYYISSTADKSTFWGLYGRYQFDSITSLNCYTVEGVNGYVCLVNIKIKDSGNNATLSQQYNLLIRSEGTRYYIQDMNTKTMNLNY